MDWRTAELDVVQIFVGGLVLAAIAAILGSTILYVVGETVEHFTR
jgi:hypothetical protein